MTAVCSAEHPLDPQQRCGRTPHDDGLHAPSDSDAAWANSPAAHRSTTADCCELRASLR